jgi:hypothetical protein
VVIAISHRDRHLMKLRKKNIKLRHIGVKFKYLNKCY